MNKSRRYLIIILLSVLFFIIVSFISLNIKDQKKEYNILFLGDSVTEFGCPRTDILEKRLNENDMHVSFKITNLAKAGSDINDLISSYNRISNKSRFDIVYFQSGWNEHWYSREANPCIRAGCYRNLKDGIYFLNMSKNNSGIKKEFASMMFRHWLSDNSIRCGKVFFENPEMFLDGIDHKNTSIYRTNLSDYSILVRKLIDIIRNNDSDVVAIITPDGLIRDKIPYMSIQHCTLLDKDMYYEIHYLYSDELREITNDKSVPILDLQNNFKTSKNHEKKYFSYDGNKSYVYYNDPIHPNELGKDICTDMFYEDILKRTQEIS